MRSWHPGALMAAIYTVQTGGRHGDDAGIPSANIQVNVPPTSVPLLSDVEAVALDGGPLSLLAAGMSAPTMTHHRANFLAVISFDAVRPRRGNPPAKVAAPRSIREVF